MLILRILFFCPLIFFTLQTHANENTAIVAVAANFSPAFKDIVNQFKISTGYHIKVAVGSSGALARQIEQGAPFELFLSADEAYVKTLYNEGLTPDTGRIYAEGKLVLFISDTSHLKNIQNVEDIITQAVSDKTCRIAIANPDLAPYGLAARQVLNHFTPVKALEKRLVLGENVGQTAQFSMTGSVDVAFLPYSLAITHELDKRGHFEIVPTDWYNPIYQRMVLLKNAGNPAKALYEFMNSRRAREIIIQYGYSFPLN